MEQSYRDGALSRKHKELMGLALTFACSCGDCVRYHLQQLGDLRQWCIAAAGDRYDVVAELLGVEAWARW